MSARPGNKRSTVYYDGSCPMCTVVIGKLDGSSKSSRFATKDITKTAPPKGSTREQVEKEIHVVAEGKVYRNSDAILKILEEYPSWRHVVRFGRLPIIRNILPVGYKFVAANRHFIFGPASRLYWLKVILGTGFITGLLLSVKLWVESRFFPLTPVIEGLPSIPYPVDYIMFFALLGALAAAVLAPKPRPFIWSAVVLVAVLVLLDQQRLQPWVYQYTLMLMGLGLFSWKWRDVKPAATILNTARFVLAGIYFWSGLQKLNAEFVTDVFPWMIEPAARLFPEAVHPLLHAFGVFVPIIEMAIGIGLLFKKFRNLAVLLALATTGFVLAMIGPFGHSWNSVVWPWNVVMALLVILLFVKTPDVSWRNIIWVKGSVYHKIVLAAFGILPLLNFFNMWDSYLSWSLYSGNTNSAVITVDAPTAETMPDYVQGLMHKDQAGDGLLSPSEWAFDELNVPAYPEARIFRSVAQDICKDATDPQAVVLAMTGRASWFNRDNWQVLDCSQL